VTIAACDMRPAECSSLIAWQMFAGGMTAGFIVEAHSGLGHHIMTVSPDHAVRFGKAYYATNLLYIGALVCVKVSIVFLFLRILNTARVHRVCYGVLGFILLFGLYSIITNIFICYPQAKFWDPFHHPEGWCFPIRKFWSDVAGHLVGEFMLLILPMPYIFKLKMPLKQKAAVGSLFAMGAFVIIISFIRIPSLRKAETSQDPTWDGVDGAVWSCVEICIAIVCACSMTLRPLASKVLPGLISSSYVQASGPSGQKRRILTVGSERKHRRTHGSTSAAGSGSGRSMLDMDEVPHLPAKPSYSTMSQSTAVLSDTSRSPRSMDDTEKGLGHGHPF